MDTITVPKGINNDRYKVWRNELVIGAIHLAFKVILLSLDDFFYGDASQMISASLFFFDEDSSYQLWKNILGIDPDKEMPILNRWLTNQYVPTKEEFNNIERLYKKMVIK